MSQLLDCCADREGLSRDSKHLLVRLRNHRHIAQPRPPLAGCRYPHQRGARGNRRAAEHLLSTRRRHPSPSRRVPGHGNHACSSAAEGDVRGPVRSSFASGIVDSRNLRRRLQQPAFRRRSDPLQPVPQFLRSVCTRMAGRQQPLGPDRSGAYRLCTAPGRNWLAGRRRAGDAQARALECRQWAGTSECPRRAVRCARHH